MEIKPIETEYNGYKFRSRLEARWAVFFDTLGVDYEYEPEGFVLPSGEKYLPDFRVKCHGTRGNCSDDVFDLYIEVKGNMTKYDADRIKEFAGSPFDENGIFNEELAGKMNPTLIVGKIPPKNCSGDSYAVCAYDKMNGIDIYPFNYQLIDGDYFAAYPAAYNGRFFLWGDDSNYIWNTDEVELAFDVARKARFEHGENPVIKHG